ncbi:hypothetical protein LX87_04512 [Larkinella arboricola]|uniref:Uncharacterized protein n=2 Tax=Larkinella arboricola TaxID=643671 RepID=A0A327WV72_LARAB|nr:hypothetical protein LX87_04512 [Larkinella arboricola]
MKKYTLLLALITSLFLSNCKQDKMDPLLPSSHRPSAARVGIEAAPAKQWDLTKGGTGQDMITSTTTWWNGNIILGGYSDSPATGDKQSNPAYGGLDYWIIQLEPNGTLLGRKTLGGSGDDYLTAVATGTDRGLLVGGYSNSSFSQYKSEPCRGSMDYYIVKLSAGGMVQWNRTLGGSKQDVLSSIVATSDGGFLLAGSSASPAGGDKTQNSQGGLDYWVVKIDAKGNKQWDKTIGGPNDDHLTSLVATNDGGFLLGGYSLSGLGGDKSRPGNGRQDVWFVKIDANGRKLWDKSFGGDGADMIAENSIVKTADGGFVLGGYTHIENDPYQGALNLCWVYRIDANGNEVWLQGLGQGTWFSLLRLLPHLTGVFWREVRCPSVATTWIIGS